MNAEMTSEQDDRMNGTVPHKEPKYTGIQHFFAAFRYSLDGFKAVFKHEAAFRQEVALAVPHFAAVLILGLSLELKLYLSALWVVLICFELMNSGIEAIVDLVSPGWNELAKRAKDIGSAAVFSMLVLFWGSWFFVVLNLLRG